MKGWTGKILVVDLSKMKVGVESLEAEIYERFIGGVGINAWLLWKEAPPGVNPLSPENPLILGFGPLVGTQGPSGCRATVTFKSPLTGIYGDSNVGGSFAPEVKFAGYDSIIIRGRADKPVYLWINDDEVEIRDAGHLWGKDVWETDDIIKEEVGDQGVKTLCIGPAGENLVKYAVLVATKTRVAGRCGAGCVAGFKKLKAIAVRGTKKVEVHDPEFLKHSFKEKADLFNRPDNFLAQMYRRTGSLGGIAKHSTVVGCAAAYNWQNNVYDKWEDICGETFEAKYKTGNRSCFRCPLGCGQAWEIKEGRFAGEVGTRVELIPGCALGVAVGNNDLASILHLMNLTAKLGVDVNELGVTLAMAMECWEKGILTGKDTGGIKLNWGNVDSIIELTKLTSHRKGFGQILAEGVKRAADIIGKEAPDYAMHVKGLAMSAEELRTRQEWALSFAVNVRGGDHLKGTPLFYDPQARELVRNIFGIEEVSDACSPIAKGRVVWWAENEKALIDSLGMCKRVPWSSTILSTEKKFDYLYQLFIKATGSKMDFNEFKRCGERIVQIQRAYNAREGITRKDDTLPERLLTVPVPSEPRKGMVAQLEHDGMLPEYYSYRGCDQNGLPTRQRLSEVGLDDVANELDVRGKLSRSKDRIEDFVEVMKYLE